MRDLSLALEPRPGALADFGETLGAAGVSLEGGGVFGFDGVAIAHFLIGDHDVEAAVAALEAAGFGPATVSAVVALRLDQDRPGQLGAFTRRLGDAGIDIRVQYSDHDHRLILVVDPERHVDAARIAAAWARASA
ncbi:hypothetical protein ACFPER_09580 [Agromyces aurantiacus]|uniref:Amino acid-binding ACT domain-containing protein n=1 Tax=Agromyces aurantiacus TaxID=165814 RepID=A0ABV9R4X6_9MICO|nr:hypothetical protein [Agromyces aurantiacus]MBM7503724.1 hypothetical protein [Agromyces aurantiacus]